ncbi:Hypothetical predicted protein [Prunus dulcis]|uniref:Uncharacterized protein n=1 Tax=Prunus dulcis TaxID=3755 RepID=A0A5E4FH61_PRUDU|nr:Hypothetical predicted protein [Prunus dulcis]
MLDFAKEVVRVEIDQERRIGASEELVQGSYDGVQDGLLELSRGRGNGVVTTLIIEKVVDTDILWMPRSLRGEIIQ